MCENHTRKRGLSLIIIVALLLLAVMLMNTGLLFSQTRQQTKQSGIYQLESVSGRLEATINDARLLTVEEAAKAGEHLSDRDEMRNFVYSEKNRIVTPDSGVFNIYVANDEYMIIPDFTVPEDYVLAERVWYTGALKNQGTTYVSSPYQDVMTGDICYTVSVTLPDGRTVIGVDYTMDNIQKYIAQMGDNAVNAVIVTDEGAIAGCSDESLIGEKLTASLPEYAGIYASAKNRDGVATGRVKRDLLYENLFAARSGNGWYLIVGIDDYVLYKNSYIQLFGTLLLFLAIFAVITKLYLSSLKSREKAETALASREAFMERVTGELVKPLKRIMDSSDKENVRKSGDYEADMASIHSAARQLSDMVGQIMSYKSLVLTEDSSGKGQEAHEESGLNVRFRTIIIGIMIVVMLLSLNVNIFLTYNWGNARMANEAGEYEYQLSEWVDTQKSILDMFVSVISTNPEMLDDYEQMIDYLNRITVQYPEISVTYMANPNLEHTVYMNNGWEPDDDWHVEERQWYLDTISSDSDWNISSPYYDEQTGGYCVTISETVYDSRTGDFLGIFGIDFFMDKLVNILGDSYSEEGYAFLVDSEGKIINHPYGAYQMSRDHETNISDLPYGDIAADGRTTDFFWDYDRTPKILLATRNDVSKFTVYVVYNAWPIYGKIVSVTIIGIVAFLVCIILVYRILTSLIRWQDETNRKLTDAADAAIAAGRAKSSFLAQMSHEIRTPLNAVLGMNEMILRETGNDDIRDYSENIQSAGRTLLSLINSILDFSKIEDGKMELVPVKYDISVLLNDLVNSISERAKAKGLEFELIADGSLPRTLYGDDVRIRQVIMNLLTNAVKYTEKGKVSLVVDEKERHGDSVVMSVSVKDTGIGIREDDMDRLFESFARLDEEKNRNVEGTGLGMSIVKGLLSMMGTTLSVKSEYGKGSVFSFELEQEIINGDPVGDFVQKAHDKTNAGGKDSHISAPDAMVLVVDDSIMNLKVAKGLMKRNGIVPHEAKSGAEAIEKMSATAYDLVLLDHMMPGMDGVETLHNLRAMEDNPNLDTPVICLTANAISGAREEYIEAGFDDYLSKPIDPAGLEEILKKYLPAKKISED